MKFKALPITDLTDVTLDFEQLQARAILDATFGTVTFVFTAAVASPSVVVAHGIGRTPRVWIQSQNNLLAGAVTAKSPTTFTANGFVTYNAVTTATVTMDWLAIG